MKIAVTIENGRVFQHFGHSENFKIYDTEGDKILDSHILPTDGKGHGALIGILQDAGVSALICGGIGGGAIAELVQAGIAVYGGVTGDADESVQALLKGHLNYNPEVHCMHHDHADTEHVHSHNYHKNDVQGCGHHACSGHKE